MAIQQKTVEVGGTTYMLTQFPASRGIRIMKQLVKLLGPLIAGGEAGNLGEALDKMFDSLDSIDVENLLKEMMSSVTKENMSINFDMEFAGDYRKLFELAKEVTEFNFGNVFTLAGTSVQ
ncbi:MAG TPA: hypothetical protein VFM18_15385 [Methanosarcina sp.]|nr:hypothetical protein [Methanosarcina sp.]